MYSNMALRQRFIGVKKGYINTGKAKDRLRIRSTAAKSQITVISGGCLLDKVRHYIQNPAVKRLYFTAGFRGFFTFSPCMWLLCSAPSRRLSLSPRRR